MPNRPRIGFVTSEDPADRRSWSGTYYFMMQALQRYCGDVEWIDPKDTLLLAAGKTLRTMSRLLTAKTYNYKHSVMLSKYYGMVFGRKVKQGHFDIIFAPAAASEVAFLKTDIPIIYSSDLTFSLIRKSYPAYSNFFRCSLREGERSERSAIQKARILLYPTEWAARSAIQEYGADKAKVFIAPFGANIEDIPPGDVVSQRKKSGACRLFFLGVDWERKGGDIAYEAFLELEQLGLEAELTVLGCVPPGRISGERIHVIPFLNKNDPGERKRLWEILLGSDFLLLPTRAEASAIAFCEANAFGLPVITTDTGGVSGVVRNNENGILLPLEAKGSDYARLIAEIYRDDERYRTLVRSSRAAFDERLNWDAWGRKVSCILNEKVFTAGV